MNIYVITTISKTLYNQCVVNPKSFIYLLSFSVDGSSAPECVDVMLSTASNILVDCRLMSGKCSTQWTLYWIFFVSIDAHSYSFCCRETLCTCKDCYSCHLGTAPCSAENFTEILTDHGICYTFNGQVSSRSPLRIFEAGEFWSMPGVR